MLYAALTVWLLVIVLSAWGVHSLWTGMVKPRFVNLLLLPGTLVAQLGHVLGLLVTGATVQNAALYKNDENGEPVATQNPQPRIPVVGHVIIGLLPLIACAVAIYLTTLQWGDRVLGGVGGIALPTALPTTLGAFWDLLRGQLTMAEQLLDATITVFPGSWEFWVFLYLLICFSVRMAPFPGNLRGSLGAIILLGLLSALASLMLTTLPEFIESTWQTLSLTTAGLMLMLIISAMVRGVVDLVKLLSKSS